jgi:RHS repeat-associated protein
MHWRNPRRVRRRASGRTVAYNLRFPGQVFDGQAGLHANGFRDYDPAIGRYVESDPIGLKGGSYSTYIYVNDSPLSLEDPLGLTTYFGFPPDKEAQMKAAVEEAKRKVLNCKSHTNCFDDGGRGQITKNIDTTDYTYNPRFLGCGLSNTGNNQKGNKTVIGPSAFNFSSCCDLSSTLAHEANHLVGSNGRSEDSSQELERVCFNCPRTKQ